MAINALLNKLTNGKKIQIFHSEEIKEKKRTKKSIFTVENTDKHYLSQVIKVNINSIS